MAEQEQIAVLKVSSASRALAVNKDELRRLLRSGELAGYRTQPRHGHWRIPCWAIDEYTRRQCTETSMDLH